MRVLAEQSQVENTGQDGIHGEPLNPNMPFDQPTIPEIGKAHQHRNRSRLDELRDFSGYPKWPWQLANTVNCLLDHHSGTGEEPFGCAIPEQT